MIVTRVTSNSVLVCGLFVPRPAYVTSSEWRDFWNGTGKRTLISFDYARAMVYGAVIPKTSSITQEEWAVFWEDRSDRPSIALSNARADAAYLRQRERTARKPR